MRSSLLFPLLALAACRSASGGQGPAPLQPPSGRTAVERASDGGGYVAVQRLLAVIETSIRRGLAWAVLEPNDPALWLKARRSIEDYLERVWRDGGLAGARADEAYFVRCDGSTMTQADVEAGQLVCSVGVAPVKPAEFVVFRVGLPTATARR